MAKRDYDEGYQTGYDTAMSRLRGTVRKTDEASAECGLAFTVDGDPRTNKSILGQQTSEARWAQEANDREFAQAMGGTLNGKTKINPVIPEVIDQIDRITKRLQYTVANINALADRAYGAVPETDTPAYSNDMPVVDLLFQRLSYLEHVAATLESAENRVRLLV